MKVIEQWVLQLLPCAPETTNCSIAQKYKKKSGTSIVTYKNSMRTCFLNCIWQRTFREDCQWTKRLLNRNLRDRQTIGAIIATGILKYRSETNLKQPYVETDAENLR